MDDGFTTQPRELTAAAAPFDEAARIVADALAGLRSALGGLGDYPGTDEQGRAFAAQYEPKVTEGLEAFAGEADAIRSLGDALRGSAQGYATRDADLAAGFRPP
ncbi:MAG TPA: hypothetical protein VGH76_25090 [Actinomycetospora sp.]|uniref:hypothetical protein n=1 Tax=Actinomycetospora sp. TaxID=1872135 RepID=UPI002F41A1F6